MERGCSSSQHHTAGQWRDTNRTLLPDSWVLLCLLIMLSSAVPSISIDFKLTPTFLITEGKNSQGGSLHLALLETYRMVRTNTFCKGLCCKAVQAGLTLSTILKGVPDAHKMPQTSYRGYQKMQITVITWLKLRKKVFSECSCCCYHTWPHASPPYHLLFSCQVLRVNPGWPNPTVQSDLMLVQSSSSYPDVLNSLLQELLTFANIKLLQASLVF